MRTTAVVLTAIAVLAGGFTSSHAQTAVLISEMCDPHLNYLTDRFIEIYNAGAAAVDLTDWTLVAVGNSARNSSSRRSVPAPSGAS